MKTGGNQELLLEEVRGEQKCERELADLTFGSREFWEVIRRLQQHTQMRLTLERTIRARITSKAGPQRVSPSRQTLPDVLLICPLHSRPGEMKPAAVKLYNGKVVALCPDCIEDGRKIQRERGMRMINTPLPAKVEDGKA